jgi:oligosaccharide repeat unit polymerase
MIENRIYILAIATFMGSIAFGLFSLILTGYQLIALGLVVFSVLVFLSAYKYYNDMLSPAGVYLTIWLFSAGVSNLYLSGHQQMWDGHMWLAVLGSTFAFFVGVFSFEIVRGRKMILPPIGEFKIEWDMNRFRTFIYSLFTVSLLAYLLEIRRFGIPILSGAPTTAYEGFGINYVHYLTVTFVLVIILSLSYIKAKGFFKSLSIGPIAIISIAAITSLLARGHLIMVLVMLLVVYNYMFKKISLRYLLVFMVIGLLLFNAVGNIRLANRAAWLAKHVGRVDLPNKVSWLAWPYLYISMNFENLRTAIKERDEFYFGRVSLKPLWAVTLSKSYYLRGTKKYRNYTNPGFNVSTYLADLYADFGFAGTFIVPFLLGLFSNIFYYWVRYKKQFYLLLIYGLVVYSLAWTFFSNYFNDPLLYFFIVIIIVGNFYCNKLIRANYA